MARNTKINYFPTSCYKNKTSHLIPLHIHMYSLYICILLSPLHFVLTHHFQNPIFKRPFETLCCQLFFVDYTLYTPLTRYVFVTLLQNEFMLSGLSTPLFFLFSHKTYFVLLLTFGKKYLIWSFVFHLETFLPFTPLNFIPPLFRMPSLILPTFYRIITSLFIIKRDL